MASKITGLSKSEVQQRIEAGNVNVDSSIKTRSVKKIFNDNIFTLFNFVNVVLAIIVACTGSYKNMLFMGVIVCNTAIGIIQEIRSKRTTDKLSIVAAAKVKVIRDDQTVEINSEEIVLDDIIILHRGDQVPADSVVVEGSCDCNESLLTGESDLIHKSENSNLMSGSFINSGLVYAKVIHVGADNYATKITAEAKVHKMVNSQIMETMNGLIRIVSIAIFPIGALLFCNSYFFNDVELIQAVLSTVSAMIGMIPEGLILLTSTVLAVAVVRLAKKKVLVQQLYCIETLARVNVFCADKTGTITSGAMNVDKIIPLENSTEHEVKEILNNINKADTDKNETALAIKKYLKNYTSQLWNLCERIPFSSDKKWSGAIFENGSYILGAAQFILNEKSEIMNKAIELSKTSRTLLVAKVEGFDKNKNISGKVIPLGFVCIKDEIRATAKDTIQYFIDEGVQVKVISGDDPRTVSNIADKVGVVNAKNYVDATTLKTQKDIEDAVLKYSVFGRVKPEQKKQIVIALQKFGNTVAMTGDGVNDVLSLKQADCSIAMASGSSAARNIANLVLLENDFAAMTNVVSEGRRSINNLQRSASLFLVKTILSMLLAIVFIVLPWGYPFEPIQMTLISAFTIGVPSFVLALEPNHERIKGQFLVNVIVRSIPSAVVIFLSILAINHFGYNTYNFDYHQISTMCVITMAFIGFMLVVKLSIPFTAIRALLLVFIIAGTTLGCTVFSGLFNILEYSPDMIFLHGLVCVIGSVAFFVIYHFVDKWYVKHQEKFV